MLRRIASVPVSVLDALPVVPDSTLQRVRWVSHLLDDAIRIPGTNRRFGLDPVVGLLPVAGDAVTSVIALYLVLEALAADVPATTVLRMLAIIAANGLVGSIPLAGTLIDAGWKSNQQNARLLEAHLEPEGEPATVGV